MNEITRMYKDHPVRIVEQDGDTWFIAKDVADILGYSNTAHMTRRLDEDEKGETKMDTLGGAQVLSTINESGLYHAAFGSSKEEAKDFRRWVTYDVLPSIRKTGGYTVPQNPEQITDANLRHIADILKSCAEIARENSVLSERNSYLAQFAPTGDYGDPNREGNPRFQKRRGYFCSGKGADVAKRDPEKYGYQQDLFYDRLPQILMESFTSAVKRITEGD